MKLNIKSSIKMYAKIFVFACVFWIIAAVWYYFVPYKDAIVRFPLIKSFEFSLYKMRWVFAVLLPGIIFLFWWIEGKIKAFIKEVKTPGAKTNETGQEKQIERDFDRKKAMSRFIE
jgi:hypothetical protein